MSFMSDISPLLNDSITITPGYENTYGDFITTGEVLNDVPCRLSTKARFIRDKTGQETVSSVKAILDGFYDLDVDRCRFTLPSTYDPHENIKALSIKKVTDENGPLYEVVMLP